MLRPCTAGKTGTQGGAASTLAVRAKGMGERLAFPEASESSYWRMNGSFPEVIQGRGTGCAKGQKCTQGPHKRGIFTHLLMPCISKAARHTEQGQRRSSIPPLQQRSRRPTRAHYTLTNPESPCHAPLGASSGCRSIPAMEQSGSAGNSVPGSSPQPVTKSWWMRTAGPISILGDNSEACSKPSPEVLGGLSLSCPVSLFLTTSQPAAFPSLSHAHHPISCWGYLGLPPK